MRSSRNKNELVKCEYCGEMYSTSYKHCPFCNEDGTGRWDDPVVDEEELDYDEGGRGGKRLQGGAVREGISLGTIIGGVLSLALIIAAVCIVISIVRSMTGGKTKEPTPSANPSAPVTESLSPEESQAPVETAPVESQPVTPVTPEVDVVKPTDFTLNRTDFTFSAPGEVFDMVATLTPADATAEVTWTSSDPNVASISWNGRVTAVSRGTVTLTATVEGVGSKTCICRCNFTGTATGTTTSDPGTTTGSTGGLTISRTDFTLSKAGESWRLLVEGTNSPVTWTSSKPEVATVDADGKVTAVSKGTCTVTAEVDGSKLTCIVRCTWN